MLTVELEIREGKALLGSARKHRIVTDRPTDEGGRDLGCTSGELMLLAAGSCALGSLRSYAARQALPIRVVAADVFVEPAASPDSFGRIVIAARVMGALGAAELFALTEAGGSGRVVGRLLRGAEVDIRVMDCADDQQNSGSNL